MPPPALHLQPGEPVPWFVCRSIANPHYHFGSVAGRHILLLFAASLADAAARDAHGVLKRHRTLFDDTRCSLFVVTADDDDVASARAQDSLPGVRVLRDSDGAVSQALRPPGAPSLLLLDPALRVVTWFRGSDALLACATIAALPQPLTGCAQPQAPVAIVPRVFEPAFCRELIAHYEAHGGEDSGYMRRDPDGIRGVIDYRTKRRSDCTIEDETLRKAIALRIQRRLAPEIRRVFRFDPTRMERYIVACYDAEVGGHFRPHRDNDGDGHRQFAVTINLNAEAYEGGDLCFPEYGQLTYRAPTGGACVFSCGLMHEATPVTRGRRYAFLPFLYDEASARRREENNAKYVDPAVHYFVEPR